jgi:predicted nuclease of predicted toxin-antitoxin system
VKVLFDQNVPRNLRRHLKAHEVMTSREMGWATLANGDLLNAAESGGFQVFVTGDRNLERQQNLEGRTIAIVVLTRNNWSLVRPHTVEVALAVDSATTGSHQTVECSPQT